MNIQPLFKVQCKGVMLTGLIGSATIQSYVRQGILSQADAIRILALNPGEQFEDASHDRWTLARPVS